MNIYRIKIFGSIFISFIVSALIANTFFLTNSPRVRPDLGPYLTTGFSNNILLPLSQVLGSVGNLVRIGNSSQNSGANSGATANKVSANDVIKALESTPFTTKSTGIYSKQNSLSSYIVIKDQEVNWLSYGVNINGRLVTVYIPKGESPLTVDDLKKILAQ